MIYENAGTAPLVFNGIDVAPGECCPPDADAAQIAYFVQQGIVRESVAADSPSDLVWTPAKQRRGKG